MNIKPFLKLSSAILFEREYTYTGILNDIEPKYLQNANSESSQQICCMIEI